MKAFKIRSLIVIIVAVLLSSCASLATSYIGETLPATSKLDVFYAAKDIKQDYKVIGHLITSVNTNVEAAKRTTVKKAKEIGADGIIFTNVDFTGGGDPPNFITSESVKSEAIKYKN
ncbi:hypothetical protein [Pedobacter cryoconitis]|uniref:Archaellum component FlaG (FlaF/FlaG flagellin family) n=1 Tax=Pedobacter cryoconitis TaxID=188932 RepID=A0A7X0J1Q0_9SPHI|nr:hypothetical protein [Pedobacter cryoconitis]MBB6498832.1 archaellum component FlaG (FlaF/FlaG flagellin family) [Pedobacter cryoconitis]